MTHANLETTPSEPWAIASSMSCCLHRIQKAASTHCVGDEILLETIREWGIRCVCVCVNHCSKPLHTSFCRSCPVSWKNVAPVSASPPWPNRVLPEVPLGLRILRGSMNSEQSWDCAPHLNLPGKHSVLDGSLTPLRILRRHVGHGSLATLSTSAFDVFGCA